ncbi:cytochrome P450 [Luteococcus peritonei]|uniref:Cytochrome P450 n=1 Tax=Luteococcus peritonei TaxID=88874 RepID=A0ABW4RS38_9ACTN
MSLSTTVARWGDQSLSFLRDGYLFQERARRAQGRDAGDPRPLALRLLGRPALLVRGAAGVELFYDDDLMKRHGAMPVAVQGPLFGEGAVHTLDDEAHRARKAQFIAIAYDDAQVERFKPILAAEVEKMMIELAAKPSNVYDATVLAYGRAALRWAGVPGDDAELDPWAIRLGEIVDGFGKLSPAHAKAWLNRRRCDEWYQSLVERTRSGEITPAPETALARWAAFTDHEGRQLDAKTAGVELQNSTRPTIAVARFAAFAARALVVHPEYRQRIADEVAEREGLLDGPFAIAFAQEVRRVFPFVPMLPAFARKDFTYQGQQVRAGQRVLLDVLGTNTDPSEWDEARRFNPDRFLGVDGEQVAAFIPQGGSSVHTGHRCPGEKIAVTCLSATVSALSRPGVELEQGGLEFSWTTMPTRPESGVRVRIA